MTYRLINHRLLDIATDYHVIEVIDHRIAMSGYKNHGPVSNRMLQIREILASYRHKFLLPQ